MSAPEWTKKRRERLESRLASLHAIGSHWNTRGAVRADVRAALRELDRLTAWEAEFRRAEKVLQGELEASETNNDLTVRGGATNREAHSLRRLLLIAEAKLAERGRFHAADVAAVEIMEKRLGEANARIEKLEVLLLAALDARKAR